MFQAVTGEGMVTGVRQNPVFAEFFIITNAVATQCFCYQTCQTPLQAMTDCNNLKPWLFGKVNRRCWRLMIGANSSRRGSTSGHTAVGM